MWPSFTGTAQPPEPLQEFLPAQPLSPPLQPPWPLHAFFLSHSCLASAAAQPPLPLQSFLPAQPEAPVLQPPWPLQEFWPLQTCFGALSSALAWAETRLPAIMPAVTAPMIFVNSRRSMDSLLKVRRPPRKLLGLSGGEVCSRLGSLCARSSPPVKGVRPPPRSAAPGCPMHPKLRNDCDIRMSRPPVPGITAENATSDFSSRHLGI